MATGTMDASVEPVVAISKKILKRHIQMSKVGEEPRARRRKIAIVMTSFLDDFPEPCMDGCRIITIRDCA